MTSPSRTRALTSGLVLTMWLAWTSIAGCNADMDELVGTGYYESRVAPGPQKRSRKNPDARCYESFDKFKSKEERAGDDMQWHHIVGQHPANERKFGKLDLNCTDNVIRISKRVHQKINGHYASKPDFANGQTVRDWQAEKSFDEQYEYGVKVLQDYGIVP